MPICQGDFAMAYLLSLFPDSGVIDDLLGIPGLMAGLRFFMELRKINDLLS